MFVFFLSLTTNIYWPLQQFDVKNVFLHRDLEEEVYKELPLGFMEDSMKNKGCRLNKALYDLKLLSRAWFGRFAKAMKKMGYCQSQEDHTLFIRHLEKEMITTLILYVDDIVVTRDDLEEIEKLKKKFANEFEIKNLGRLKYFLGIGYTFK